MRAGARLGSQWTARRKPCVSGPLRRAHPASGATWNVQVVKGKVTSECLWHACRALSLGLLLMALGAAMATIGYYADHLSTGQEVRGNATVRIKNESRGFHLNNLSYAGPIVMGVGGFIVVAACVMTFEARDSAAKVTPARPRGSATAVGTRAPAQAGARRCAASQTGPARWDRRPGPPPPPPDDRKALTEAFLRFSADLGENRAPNRCGVSRRRPFAGGPSPAAPRRIVPRSGSVPDLDAEAAPPRPIPRVPAGPRPRPPPRQALSVDETRVRFSRESLAGSQASMAMDLHVPSDAPVTLRVRDRSRRRPLSRQRQIADEDDRGGASPPEGVGRASAPSRSAFAPSARDAERDRDTRSCSPRLSGRAGTELRGGPGREGSPESPRRDAGAEPGRRSAEGDPVPEERDRPASAAGRAEGDVD